MGTPRNPAPRLSVQATRARFVLPRLRQLHLACLPRSHPQINAHTTPTPTAHSLGVSVIGRSVKPISPLSGPLPSLPASPLSAPGSPQLFSAPPLRYSRELILSSLALARAPTPNDLCVLYSATSPRIVAPHAALHYGGAIPGPFRI
jgi:hypothetical protein